MTVARTCASNAASPRRRRSGRLSGEEPGYLLRGPPLDQLAAWAAATDLSLHPSEQALLDTSVARRNEERLAEQHRREEEQRLRRKTRVRTRQLIGSAVVLALVAGLAAFAIVKGSEASGLNVQLTPPTRHTVSSTAATNLSSRNPELATLLALQALDTSAAQGSARGARSRGRAALGHPGDAPHLSRCATAR